jgi:YfiH family protein
LPFSLVAKKKGSIGFLYSPKLFLEENILVAFSMRTGGASSPPYDSLNLGLHVGDSRENVLRNRRLFLSLLELDADRITTAEQVHGSNCVVIDSGLVGKGARSHEDSIPNTDALITGVEGIPLALFFADCVPVIVVDPKKRCIAVIHAGWRGIVNDIIQKTLQEIVRSFTAQTSDFLAYIGPCIGECCYEIDAPLQEIFGRKFDTGFESGRINLPLLAAGQLVDQGVLRERILRADICTSCSNDEFFSYRRAKKTGRHAALAALLVGNHAES